MNLEIEYDPTVTETIVSVSQALEQTGLSDAITLVDTAMFGEKNVGRSFAVTPTEKSVMVSLEPYAELALWHIKGIALKSSQSVPVRMASIQHTLRLAGYRTFNTDAVSASSGVLDWSSTCS